MNSVSVRASRKTHLSLLSCLTLAASVMSPLQSLQARQKLNAIRVRPRSDVTVGGKFFTSDRIAADERYPFFFPVNAPSGASATSMRNGEYPHHSSLFFGCDKVSGGNYWQDGLGRGRIVSKGPVLESASGNEIFIPDACDWTRADAQQPIRYTRRIVISAQSEPTRQIDFTEDLEAMIEKTNHSLFSARMDPDLVSVFGDIMVHAGGDKGETGTFGKPSQWLACYGARDARTTEDLAILQHPGSQGFSSPWFTRDYGFLSPTPMFWPEDDESTRIPKGGKLRLAYRVIVFTGTAESAAIAAKYDEFTRTKQETPNPSDP